MTQPNYDIFYNKINFEKTAIELFQYQYKNNSIYKTWCNAIHTDIQNVNSVAQIPFLPISFFKTHKVVNDIAKTDLIFESSGTTTTTNSKHYINSEIYSESFLSAFRQFYGEATDYCIIGLLPSYLERNNSSLVYMVNHLIKLSAHPKSGFYLNEFETLANTLKELETNKTKTILFGVTFALLDFADAYSLTLNNTTIIETGGMKGRKTEMTRQEVHQEISNAFNTTNIHSEYGMTELLSQAYAKEDGIFYTPDWMKIVLREEDDPMIIKNEGRGLINVIDLANLDSCAFIATDDVGKLYKNGSFEVLGRRDNSDLRGCSLLSV